MAPSTPPAGARPTPNRAEPAVPTFRESRPRSHEYRVAHAHASHRYRAAPASSIEMPLSPAPDRRCRIPTPDSYARSSRSHFRERAGARQIAFALRLRALRRAPATLVASPRPGLRLRSRDPDPAHCGSRAATFPATIPNGWLYYEPARQPRPAHRTAPRPRADQPDGHIAPDARRVDRAWLRARQPIRSRG